MRETGGSRFHVCSFPPEYRWTRMRAITMCFALPTSLVSMRLGSCYTAWPWHQGLSNVDSWRQWVLAQVFILMTGRRLPDLRVSAHSAWVSGESRLPQIARASGYD